ncbi:MAG: preprotein translocase subunit YajC [Clostridia bacterium]|nr:preprotein translocase subunit YajC [Clostridia bacterium]
MTNIFNLYATGAGDAIGGGSGTFTIVWLIIMVALFYFMLIRPQKKKEKADRQLRASLQAGDKIVTIGGFTGRILSVKDDEVTFETGAAKTRLTVKKWAIQTREGPEAVEAAEAEAQETEESK